MITPINELKHLLDLHKLYLFSSDPQDLLPLEFMRQKFSG